MLSKKNNSDSSISQSLNMIGIGTLVKGDLSSDGDLRIDGKIEGNVLSKSKIATGPSSEIIGNMTAQNADISGKIEGEVIVLETLYLRATSKVKGNIKCGKLIIESGSEFNGQCQMNVSQTISSKS